MISGMQLLVGIAVFVFLVTAVGGAAALGYCAFRMYRGFVRAVGDLTRSAEQMTSTVSLLSQISKSTESFGDLPKLLKGHHRVGAAMVQEVARFRAAVQAFSALIMDPNQKGSLQVPEDAEKDRFFRIEQLLQERPELSRESAAALVDSDLGEGYASVGVD